MASIIRQARKISPPRPKATGRRRNSSSGCVPWAGPAFRTLMRSWRNWSPLPPRGDPVPEKQSLTLPRRNENPDFQRGSIFFVGTATVVIRYAGFTILTDPNFLHAGDHVHLGYGLTSVRRTDPAVEIEDLPPLDFVLLSHLHGDHFDRVAERKLNKATPIVSTRRLLPPEEGLHRRARAPYLGDATLHQRRGAPRRHGDAGHPRARSTGEGDPP